MKYTNISYEEVYVIHYSISFSQIMLKTFIRALDKVISYIAMVINKNYNSNMYWCINNKQLIKSTHNYSKVLTNFVAINSFQNDHPSKTEKTSFTTIYKSVSFEVF